MADVLHSENRNISRANHSKAVKYVRVESAAYAGDYKVSISFDDGSERIVDFGPYLIEKPHPQYNKYLDTELFKIFSVEMGNVVWGENWDLIFPIEQLHQGRIS